MKLTLSGYRTRVGTQWCQWCRTRLPQAISHYDHPGGWEVKGYRERQWLYIECVNPDSGYQWALWKLGVGRVAPAVQGPWK